MKRRTDQNNSGFNPEPEEIFPFEMQAEEAKERVWSNIRRRKPMLPLLTRAAALLLILLLLSGNIWLLYEKDRIAGTLSELQEGRHHKGESQYPTEPTVVQQVAPDHAPEPEIRHHYIDRLVKVRVADTVYLTDTIHLFREIDEQQLALSKPDTVFIERLITKTPSLKTFDSIPQTIVVIDDQKPPYEQRKRVSFSLLSFQ